MLTLAAALSIIAHFQPPPLRLAKKVTPAAAGLVGLAAGLGNN